MTHPDGSRYTVEERRRIVAEARATARELLRKLELLASMDGRNVDVAEGERPRADGEPDGPT